MPRDDDLIVVFDGGDGGDDNDALFLYPVDWALCRLPSDDGRVDINRVLVERRFL